jgi:asparagine synthase (glutamine-hydrolysing)
MKRWFCGSVINAGDDAPKTSFEPSEGKAIWKGSSSFWLCGNWQQQQQLVTLADGSVQMIIVGTCLAAREMLLERLQSAARSGDYSLLMQLPGNYNAIILDANDTYVFVDAMGVRSVFYTVWQSSVFYSSLAVALQQLIGAEVDYAWLATSLAGICTLSLVQNRSPFRDIYPIPPGHYLHIASGRPTCKRYWFAPSEYKPFSQAAALLRKQLLLAVEGRAELYGNISSDLSGGFDSTTLAMIAAKKLEKTGGKLSTITLKTFSAIQSSDVRSAEHAASLYSSIDALMLEGQDIPSEYSHLELVSLTDFPDPSHAYGMGVFNPTMQLIASTGSRVHMSGEGGDAVLLAAPYSYCVDLLKQAKFSKFLQHLSGWCRMRQLPLLPLLVSAAKQSLTSYPRWLQQINQLKAGNLTLRQQSLSWDLLPTIASWHSTELVQLVLEELQRWATVATPLSHSMGEHVSIALIQLNALSARSTQQMADLYDVNLEYPYFDQLVVEACLSARPEERTSPSVFKPLMPAAFHHELPPSIYARTAKGEYVADEFIGLRENRETINAFLESSMLADMGLIDLKILKVAMQDFEMGFGAELAFFGNTLATEIWLRRLTESDRIFWSNRSDVV